jgi:hypothetical protein
LIKSRRDGRKSDAIDDRTKEWIMPTETMMFRGVKFTQYHTYHSNTSKASLPACGKALGKNVRRLSQTE